MLKFVEEPPKQTQIFIFTSNHKRLPSTIKSRNIAIRDYNPNQIDQNNDEIKKLLNDFNNPSMSLTELQGKLKSYNNNDIQLFLQEILNNEKLSKMSFMQLSYIQGLLNNVNYYEKTNLPLLDTCLPVLKKIHTKA